MYTTRPLSLYKNSPGALSQQPEGPNSGYLVLQDEEATPTRFFGLCKDPAVKYLPFPQNKLLTVIHRDQDGNSTSHDEVYLIPVINQPLLSNRYYAIKADGKRKGEAYASSKEDDQTILCFCIPVIKDVKPRPFNPEDIYQQFEFSITKTSFNRDVILAKSMAHNGHPPSFLRGRGLEIDGKTPRNFSLGEANGVNASLRASLPDFNFPISQQCSNSLVVGKWYCPFMFIKQGSEEERFKNSVFYEMILEQRWERVFSIDNTSYDENKSVRIDVVIPTENVKIYGHQAEKPYKNDGNGVAWFKSKDGEMGLSDLIVERMMWEEERVGWIKGNDDSRVRVVKDEEYGGATGWKSFGCYALVESFVLKRIDTSVVMTFDFIHTHNLRTKWE